MQKKTRNAWAGLLMAAALFLGSCKGGTKDSDIQTSFNEKQSQDTRLANISATVADGVLTLNGQCPDPTCMTNAEQAAKDIKGVKSVVNHITVPPPAAPVEISNDAALESSVKDAVKDYPGVTATVSNGTVVLAGSIERSRLTNLMQSLQAQNIRNVDNKNLTIK